MWQNVVPYTYGHPIWVYTYGMSHMHIGQYSHMGQNRGTSQMKIWSVKSRPSESIRQDSDDNASSGSDRDERHPPAKKKSLIKAMCLQVEVSGESARPKPDTLMEWARELSIELCMAELRTFFSSVICTCVVTLIINKWNNYIVHI